MLLDTSVFVDLFFECVHRLKPEAYCRELCRFTADRGVYISEFSAKVEVPWAILNVIVKRGIIDIDIATVWNFISGIINSRYILDLNNEIISLAQKIYNNIKLSTQDSLQLATAVFYRMPLFTSDVEFYEKLWRRCGGCGAVSGRILYCRQCRVEGSLVDVAVARLWQCLYTSVY